MAAHGAVPFAFAISAAGGRLPVAMRVSGIRAAAFGPSIPSYSCDAHHCDAHHLEPVDSVDFGARFRAYERRVASGRRRDEEA
jgi:hypothetical protein